MKVGGESVSADVKAAEYIFKNLDKLNVEKITFQRKYLYTWNLLILEMDAWKDFDT